MNNYFERFLRNALQFWQQQTQAQDEETVALLDQEKQNLYRLVDTALDYSNLLQDTTAVALQLFPLIERFGHWREWLPILEKLSNSYAATPTPPNVRIKVQLGQLYRYNSQTTAALSIHKSCLHIATGLNEPQLIAQIHVNLCADYHDANDLPLAQEHGQKALAIYRQNRADDMQFIAALKAMALVEKSLGRFEVAAALFQEAIDLQKPQHQPLLMARLLNDFSTLRELEGKLDAARTLLEEAASYLADTPYRYDLGRIYSNIGVYHFRNEAWEKAEAFFMRADNIFTKEKDIYQKAIIQNNLGNVYLRQNQLNAAKDKLKRAIQLFEFNQSEVSLGNSHGTLAELYARDPQKIDKAKKHYQDSLAYLEKYPHDAWARALLQKYSRQYKAL